jgi:AraC-like DNA-binding protein
VNRRERVPDPKYRGVLNTHGGEQPFVAALYQASPELAELVEHYWTVRWEVPPGSSHLQHTLSNPSVHLVVERGRSGVQGPVTGRFTRLLEGSGRAFGIKFRPAGFHPFLGSPVSQLADRRVPIASVFGPDGDALEKAIDELDDDPRSAGLADAFIRERLPAPDPTVATINAIAARALADREITRVDHLLERVGVGKRTLQRLFSEYVGVSPKWIIRRYRLYEAAERLAAGQVLNLAALAQELNYFDQAHFARDFKAIVGSSPAHYAHETTQTPTS